MSASERPPEAWMVIRCSLPVPLSLAETAMKLGEAIYKAQEEAATPEDGDISEATEEDREGVVDAEFEEVDDGKKS